MIELWGTGESSQLSLTRPHLAHHLELLFLAVAAVGLSPSSWSDGTVVDDVKGFVCECFFWFLILSRSDACGADVFGVDTLLASENGRVGNRLDNVLVHRIMTGRCRGQKIDQ